METNKIIERYNAGVGLETLSLDFHMGKKRLRSILLENGVELRHTPGKKPKEKNYKIKDWRTIKYPNVEGYHYIATFKDDGMIFNDYMNNGGFLTSYIKKMKGIDVPSLYARRIYYMETGNYWWEQWFDITLIKDEEVKKCPYCNWTTIDTNNKSGAFEVHLRECHNKTIEDYLAEYPKDKEYFQVYTKKCKKIDKLKHPSNYVVCPICQKKMEKITYWHVKSKHQMTFGEFKEKYPDTPIISSNMAEQTLTAQTLTNLVVSKDRFISHYEREIREFLDGLGVNYEANRSILIGKEIDIMVPDKRIGIEFDGLKFHTEWFGKKKHDYHLNKTKMCNEQGYGLIHIFEDEFVEHRDIVLNKIKHLLHLDDDLPRIYARKCKIKEIYKHDAELFLNANHIQGYTSASVYLGAFYKEELVAVMCFKNGGIKHTTWELVRFATDMSKVCCGIGGKLFKYFIRCYEPQSVISFADRRWTISMTDNLYTKLGFKLEKIGAPDYRYYNDRVDKYKRVHKMSFTKQKLNKKYGFPMTMTEAEMAKELGYDRIWDCGLFKYVWQNNLDQYETNGN